MEEKTVQSEAQEIWVVIPGMYEKWVNPSNRNDKHYRAILRSNKGGRRVSDIQFPTATAALEYADNENGRTLDAIQRRGHQRP